jgi:DUF4097 and DUF4098 domain-containing protein YvlB
MSSPAAVPRPPRSMAGPLVLIILGVLLLLRTMGIVHWSAWHVFARFWPLLLILWGIVKLVEYQQARREGLRPPRIGAGGVFLVIVLIVFGMAATKSSNVDWSALRDEINIDDEDFNPFGHTYNFDDQLSQSFPAGGSLHVVNDHGAVTVNVADGEQMKVVVRKRIGADDQQTADKYNSETKPQITVSGNVVTLNANTQAAGQHSVASDMDVYVPRKAPLSISSRRGDVNVNGRGADVDISNQRGQVSLDDLKGNAKLSLQGSSVRAERVAGNLSVEGRAKEVDVKDVEGAVRLNGEFMESVKLSKIAKGVTFKSSRTDMEFSRLDGELDLDSGDLHANSVNGPLRLLTRSKDIRIDQLSGDVRLEDSNGSIELQLKSPGNVQIQNRKGDVHVALPAKSGFQVDARARGGEIESDFAELKIENSNDQAVTRGTIGNGGLHLLINNEHGTIEIRKGATVAANPATPATPPSPNAPRTLSPPKVEQPEEN